MTASCTSVVRSFVLRILAFVPSLMLANNACAEGLSAGDRVRVEYKGGHIEGLFVSSNSERMVVATSGVEAPVTIHRESISEIQKLDGTHGHTGEGLIIGVGAGLIAGGIALAQPDDPHAFIDERGFAFVGFTLLGAASGAIIGTFIRTDRWVGVPTGNASVGMNPVTGEPSLSLAWNF